MLSLPLTAVVLIYDSGNKTEQFAPFCTNRAGGYYRCRQPFESPFGLSSIRSLTQTFYYRGIRKTCERNKKQVGSRSRGARQLTGELRGVPVENVLKVEDKMKPGKNRRRVDWMGRSMGEVGGGSW